MAVYERVAAVLADCLGIEQATIHPSSHLENDLGVESIDLLDILYRLEEEFTVPMQREDLFPDFLFTQHTKSMCDGELTGIGRAEAQKFFPFLSPVEVAALREPRSLLTVRVLVGAVEQRLESVAPEALAAPQRCGPHV
jgi:acyl carrier protein